MQAYRSLEYPWRILQRAGASIYVDVNLVGPSTRPDMIAVDFWVEVEDIDGFLGRLPSEEREGWRKFTTTPENRSSAPNTVAFENSAPD
jgi:hypothetical protein